MPQFFERRMDTQWTEFFWQYKTPASQTFDDAVMNLVWALIRISLDPAHMRFNDHTSLLRMARSPPATRPFMIASGLPAPWPTISSACLKPGMPAAEH